MNPNSREAEDRRKSGALAVFELAVGDPLKPESRKARLYLLAASMAAITIVFTGLVPTQIAFLGITIKPANQLSLYAILASVVIYFFGTFVVYGISDFVTWHSAYTYANSEERQAEAREQAEKIARLEAQLRRRQEEVLEEAKRRHAEKKLETTDAGELGPEETSRLARMLYKNLASEIRSLGHDFEAAVHEVVIDTLSEGDEQASALKRELAAQKATMREIAMLRAADEKTIVRYAKHVPQISLLRALLEFAVPLLVSVAAIIALIWGIVHVPMPPT